MNNLQKNKFCHLFVAICFFLAACGPQQNISNLQTAALKPQTRQNSKSKPYTGPVSIKIDTDLIKQTSGRKVDLSQARSDSFSIQALPEGSIVYQKEITLSNEQTFEMTEAFEVSDTSKRYSYHVAYQGNPTQPVTLSLNANGNWLAEQLRLNPSQPELLKSGYLLPQKNSLLMRFQGQTNTQITVSVVESGAAGTLLKRRNWQYAHDLNQADRRLNNDTNLFFPDALVRLGGLEPYEGDLQQSSHEDYFIGSSWINQESRSKFIVGEIWVALQEPAEENLQILLQHYPLQVKSRLGFEGVSMAHLQIQLEDASLNSLVADIQALNQRPDSPGLQNAVFSSINTVKTFALAASIQNQYNHLIYATGLNHVWDQHGINTNEAIQTWPQSQLVPELPLTSDKMWWLQASHLTDAWEYSIGQNATLAVLDDHFGYFYDALHTKDRYTQNISGYPDFKNRAVLAPANQISYLSSECKSTSFILIVQAPCDKHDTEIQDWLPKDQNKQITDFSLYPAQKFKLVKDPNHGYWVSQTAVSAMDDKYGIAGAAPASKLLPMAIVGGGSHLNIARQLGRILSENIDVDVINLSVGVAVSFEDLYFINQNSIIPSFGLTEKGFYAYLLEKMIQALANRNIIVVASAGNRGLQIEAGKLTYLPASLPYVITVGGYQPSVRGYERAIFGSSPDFHSSNYGSRVDIWAPAKDIFTLAEKSTTEPVSVPYYPNPYQQPANNPTATMIVQQGYATEYRLNSGTSYAAPLVAGTIALMKSWNKNLSYQETLNILQTTGTVLPALNFRQTPNPIGLNAFAALQDSRVGAKKAKTLRLLIRNDGSVSDSRGEIYQTIPPLNQKYPELFNPGSTLEIKGWLHQDQSSISDHEIQMLTARNTTSGSLSDLSLHECQNSETCPEPQPQIVLSTNDSPAWESTSNSIEVREYPGPGVAVLPAPIPADEKWMQCYRWIDCSFKRTFNIPSGVTVKKAKLELVVDDYTKVYLNGMTQPYFVGGSWMAMKSVEIEPAQFHSGINEIAFDVINTGGPNSFTMRLSIYYE